MKREEEEKWHSVHVVVQLLSVRKKTSLEAEDDHYPKRRWWKWNSSSNPSKVIKFLLKKKKTYFLSVFGIKIKAMDNNGIDDLGKWYILWYICTYLFYQSLNLPQTSDLLLFFIISSCLPLSSYFFFVSILCFSQISNDNFIIGNFKR